MVLLRCAMLWWTLLFVLAVEAQQVIRIPGFMGRTTQNKTSVIRIVPSDNVIVRVAKPSHHNVGITRIRDSSLTRIQPVLLLPPPAPRVNLLEDLSSMGLRKMATIIASTNLQAYFNQLGPVTLFAPTDEAFSLMSTPKDHQRLRDLVLQHVVQGRITALDVRNDVILPSLRSSAIPLRFNVYEDGQMLSVSGSQFLDDAKDSGNVRIQPIDRVLYPISNEDIVTELRLTFPRMHEFLLKASLTPQLTSGTFTVFTPTEEAFEALDPEVLQKLMHNSTLLRKVLLNHVVPGTQYSAVLAHGFSLRSLGGEPIHFTNRRGLILANGVPVVKGDISVTNGVIHAINRLLLPPELHYRRKPATIAPPPFKTTPVSRPLPSEEYLPVPVFMEPPPSVPRTLTKTISTPLQLPDGRKMTFGTANSLLRRSLLLTTLKNNGNGSDIGYTMLVPTDAAFAAMGQTELDHLRRNSRLLRRLLLCQMVEGRLNLTNSGDEKGRPIRSLGGTIIISSLNDGKSFMVGGARVLSVRQAADGLVLVTDKVTFPPPSRSVADALNKFPKFQGILRERAPIRQSLTSDGSVYTIFAPTDTALSSLSSVQLQDPKFMSELFWSHVIQGAYYRSRLSPGLRLTTVRGNNVLIHRSPSGELFVNKIPVSGDEIVAGNGVIHPIDTLLFIPASRHSSPVSDDNGLNAIAREFNATTFLEWMQKANLENLLRDQALQKRGCTLFLPTNKALSTMSPTLRSVTLGDPDRLKKFILYHVSPQVLNWDSVYDNSFMPSLLPRKKIRCNIYAKDRMPGILTVSGCRVSALRPLPDQNNATVAVIDEVMAPPVGNLALTIAKTPMLKNFTKILKVADAEDLISGGGPFTVFAPNGCAFAEMNSEEYNRLITNKKLALEFIKRYIVNGCHYSSGLYDRQTLTTRAATNLIVQVTPDCILISDSKLLYGDMSTTDGVLHVIGSLLP